MNKEIYTIGEHTMSVNEVCAAVNADPSSVNYQRYIDGELRRVIDKTLAVMGSEPASHVTRSTRQMLLYIGNQYQGQEAHRFDEFCRGLHLMSQLHFRAALAAFERVLVGQVEPDFEVFREMALRTHSICLEQLGFDDRSMDQFTNLLHRKFEETRANGRPDDVAKLLGLGRAEQRLS